MIDWFRGEIYFQHYPLPSGRLLSLDSEGNEEWVSVKRLECRSTHETNLLLRSTGSAGHGLASGLMIDGNLAKFLQGHNCFGSRDMNLLLSLAFTKIYETFEDHFFENSSSLEMTLARINRGNYLIKMFDVNNLYELDNDASVESFLHAIEMKARTRTGRALRSKGSVYFQQHSRRWAIKAYNKYKEITSCGKSHKLPLHLQHVGLEDYIKGKVRIELRLMSLELKGLGLTHGYHLSQDVIDKLFSHYIGQIEMNSQFNLVDEKAISLPRTVQSSYHLWSSGHSLKDILPVSTFYRHRKILLKYNIDISLMKDEVKESNVVPIIRVLTAEPCSIPEWAYEEGLIVS